MTRARVHLHRAFVADLEAHQSWIVEHGGRSWLDTLEQGLNDATSLVGEFPLVGVPVAQDPPFTIRRLRWVRAPYVSWYAHEDVEPVRHVWWIRLFHARQRRLEPDPVFWRSQVPSG